jgi:NAD(P)-dependent dehydrogenase (short-subunit alcohol dehydrogenase family)
MSDSGQTALVTGSSRGIGLSIVERLAREGFQVIATARDPAGSDGLQAAVAASAGRIDARALDVADFAAIDALAAELSDRGVDLLINNAAVQGGDYGDQGFGASDYETWQETLRINGLAPMKVMEAFVEHVARSERKVVVNVSSIMGSCGEPRFGGVYAYRTSKTLLNGVTATAACDLRERGITVVALHPGYVRTGLGSPTADDTPEMAVDQIWPLIASLGLEQSGAFLNCDGTPYPW